MSASDFQILRDASSGECAEDEKLDRASRDSFPGSDAPGWTVVVGIGSRAPFPAGLRNCARPGNPDV